MGMVHWIMSVSGALIQHVRNVLHNPTLALNVEIISDWFQVTAYNVNRVPVSNATRISQDVLCVFIPQQFSWMKDVFPVMMRTVSTVIRMYSLVSDASMTTLWVSTTDVALHVTRTVSLAITQDIANANRVLPQCTWVHSNATSVPKSASCAQVTQPVRHAKLRITFTIVSAIAVPTTALCVNTFRLWTLRSALNV